MFGHKWEEHTGGWYTDEVGRTGTICGRKVKSIQHFGHEVSREETIGRPRRRWTNDTELSGCDSVG